MSQNQELSVKIRFDAVGNAPAALLQMRALLKDAADNQARYNKLTLSARNLSLSSGSTIRHLIDENRMRSANLKLQQEENRLIRRVEMGHIAKGGALTDARSTLKDTIGSESLQRAQARVQAQARREYIGTPGHIQELRERQRDAKQAEHDSKAEHKAEMVAKYGRVGATVAGFGQSKGAQVASWGAFGAAGMVLGAARSGFSGTVEGNRLSAQFTLLNRELAGAFVPAIKMVTSALVRLRHFLEGMGPLGQDLLAFGTTAILATKGLSALTHGLSGHGPGELLAKLFTNRQGNFTKGSALQGGIITTAIAATLFQFQSKEAKREQAAEFGIGSKTIDFLSKASSVGAVNYIEKFHDLYDKKNKSKVTPAGASFEDIGQGYDRLLMATAEVEGGKQEEEENYLKDIYELIKEVAGFKPFEPISIAPQFVDPNGGIGNALNDLRQRVAQKIGPLPPGMPGFGR